MTHENFCYWLQGWFELNKTIDHREGITPEGLKVIEEHLQLVFKKVTSSPNTYPLGTPGNAFPLAPWYQQPGITIPNQFPGLGTQILCSAENPVAAAEHSMAGKMQNNPNFNLFNNVNSPFGTSYC